MDVVNTDCYVALPFISVIFEDLALELVQKFILLRILKAILDLICAQETCVTFEREF